MNLAPSQAEKKYINVMKVSLDDTIIYCSLPNSFNIKEGKPTKTWKHIHKMKLLMKVRVFSDNLDTHFEILFSPWPAAEDKFRNKAFPWKIGWNSSEKSFCTNAIFYFHKATKHKVKRVHEGNTNWGSQSLPLASLHVMAAVPFHLSYHALRQLWIAEHGLLKWKGQRGISALHGVRMT